MQPLSISLIIPVLNDADALKGCLDRLDREDDSVEVIVVDGGSLDGSIRVAESFSQAIIISSPAGRAKQMNAGAAKARGRVLVFLHADTFLPDDWPRQVMKIVNQKNFGLGAFRFRLDHGAPAYRVIEWAVGIRCRFFNLPYGDQALFVKKDDFDRLGGYPDQPLMEDVELVWRMKKQGRIIILPHPATSSARSWKRDGVYNRTMKNWKTYLRYRRGAPASDLVKTYKGKRRAAALFCKYPEPGKVKTRLAEGVGSEKATSIYRSLVEQTVGMLRTLTGTCDLFILYDPPEARTPFLEWLGNGVRLLPQQDGDLGRRMFMAFNDLKTLGYDDVVLVGSDCPPLSAGHIRQAFKVLEAQDVVLGPTDDGGYYLIGTGNPDPAWFTGISWSTEQVWDATVNTLRNTGHTFAVLDRLRDLDTQQDLEIHHKNGTLMPCMHEKI